MYIKCFLQCLNPRYIHSSRKIHFSLFALKTLKLTKQLKMKEKVCNKNINTAIHKWRCLKLSSKVCNVSSGLPGVVAMYYSVLSPGKTKCLDIGIVYKSTHLNLFSVLKKIIFMFIVNISATVPKHTQTLNLRSVRAYLRYRIAITMCIKLTLVSIHNQK